ncbi:MAG: hypothetical protein RJA70_865 [Pseudomonadota bacterium]
MARTRLLTVGLLWTFLLGCRSSDSPSLQAPPGPSASAAPASESASPQTPLPVAKPFVGTTGLTEQVSNGASARLVDVRAASHEGYDRVVLEFAEGSPGYRIEYVDKPVRQCGSGDVEPVEGQGWLSIQLFPADAHTPEGQPTVAPRERLLDLKNVRELQMTCDFEATVTWVVGVRSPNSYRVSELRQPSRLIVDIQH